MPANQYLSAWSSDDNRPSTVTIGLLILIGVGLLAHPIYLWPHYNQTPYSMTNVDRVTGETPPEDAVIAYAGLPADAQRAFDDARRGEFRTLWSGEDDRAISALASHRYIRSEGDYYQYSFTHGDVPWVHVGLARGLMTTVGGFLIVLGGLMGYSGTWRPVTPLWSLLVPVGVAIGLVATQAYDVVYSGAGGTLPLPHDLISFLPVMTLFLGAGSVMRRQGTTVVLSLGGVGIVLLIGGAVITDAPPVVPVILVCMLAVAGAPWLALGYMLSSPE